MRAGIAIYPYGENPYHQLLYGSLLAKHPNVRLKYLRQTTASTLLFPFVMLYFRMSGYRIVHIHWTSFGLSYDSKMPFAKTLSFLLSLSNICCLKLLGYRIVWTVHNVLPHERLTSNDELLARYLSRISSAKIVHSATGIGQMNEEGMDTGHVSVIPHGNYIGVYPDRVSRCDARRDLGIRDELVVLFFGVIGFYKGVDLLVRAWAGIEQSNVRLVIAGKCREETIRSVIMNSQKESSIDYYEGFQGDDDVERFFKACDIVCLPFRRVTTSGSALLALSFGKPIIAPRVGALRDLPDNVGYLYDPDEPGALEESLELAIRKRDDLEKLGINARKYAETLSWDMIGEATYRVYEEVLRKSAKCKE